VPDSSYDVTTDIGKTRLLVNDVADPWVFTDTEIQAFLDLEDGSIKRAAATAIDTNAGNEALASKLITSQDITVNGPALAVAMHQLAESLREQALAGDDEGYFEIITPCDPYDSWCW
jgi:hypothetical protein